MENPAHYTPATMRHDIPLHLEDLTNILFTPVSQPTVPKSLDKAMEQKNGHPAPADISIRNGPVTEEMNVDDPIANGKRKSRGSIGKPVNYNEVPSASEDEKPLVCHVHTPFCLPK